VSNLIRTLAELEAYRHRLAQLEYRLEAGDRNGLIIEAAAYIEQLLEIEVEAPIELRRVIEALIKDYKHFIRECDDVR
jgi:hypothetical protein